MTRVKHSIFSILVGNFLFLPLLVRAEGYNLLAPFAGLTGTVTMEGYLITIISVLIGIAGLLAVIMIVVSGIQLLTSSSVGARDEAKGAIGRALLGVILAISSWVLLNTINPDLLSATFTAPETDTKITPPPPPVKKDDSAPTAPGFYFWYKNPDGFKRYSPAITIGEACEKNRKNKIDVLGAGNVQTEPCLEIRPKVEAPQPTFAPGGAGTETQAHQTLCGKDSCFNVTPVGVNKPACRDIHTYQAGCTSLATIPTETLNFIKSNIYSACGNCTLVITGGTEKGHKSHGEGRAIFDLRMPASPETSALYKYISANGTSKKKCFNGNTCWLWGGYWFVDEHYGTAVRHWHVCKSGGASCNY